MIPSLPKGFSHPMRVGQGGFASVYRARQSGLDRWVAIKILREKDSAKRRELLKEGKTQARLEISAVPQVFDAFEWKGTICIVMQWIKGLSLFDFLAESPSLAYRKAIAQGFVNALATLHDRGFAHRDLKPANTIVSPDRGVLFVDFGFTKSVSDGVVSVAGVVKGTPAYMAPELWRGSSDIDYMRADVFSAGRILGELLRDFEPAHALIDRLTSEDPFRRPKDGVELRALCWESGVFGDATVSFKKIVGSASSIALSEKLSRAAKELLYASRGEEAYWLLVESLEENPNNSDAVVLMNSFARYKHLGAKRRYAWYGAAALLALALGLSGYFLGRGTGTTVVVTPSDRHQRTVTPEALFALSPRNASTNDLPLVTRSSGQGNRLTGRLFLKRLPEDGFLTVNSDTVRCEDASRLGLRLPPGENVVALYTSGGHIQWRERVSILPFETMVISLPRKGSS